MGNNNTFPCQLSLLKTRVNAWHLVDFERTQNQHIF